MTDVLDILFDWLDDATQKGSDEIPFIKDLITEITSLRYLTENPGYHINKAGWQIVDDTVAYSNHKVSCAIKYGKCTCGFEEQVKRYNEFRNYTKRRETANSEKENNP